MPLPTDRKGLESDGYRFINAGTCRGCSAPMEWWKTPHGYSAPFVVRLVDGVEKVLPHWADCPEAKKFRKAKA
jgi:hypothetical protein